MLPRQLNKERWLKEKICRLENYPHSEKQILTRRLKARLAKILVKTGLNSINKIYTIIQSIFINLIGIVNTPGNNLASFTEKLLKLVLNIEAFHTNTAFNQQIINMLLNLRTK